MTNPVRGESRRVSVRCGAIEFLSGGIDYREPERDNDAENQRDDSDG